MKILCIILSAVFTGLCIWSVFIEPYLLHICKIKIKNKNLAGKRIVFASDFHIKPYEKFRLKKIIKEINKQKPDIVLLGGDFVNGHKPNITYPPQKIASELKNIKSELGIYTVLGNHDGLQGKYQIIKCLEENNIHVLENTNIKTDKFTIAGVEDLKTGTPKIREALNGAGENIILLSHTPDIFPNVPDSVILTLAGHLHCGQINIPFIVEKYTPSIYGKKYLHGITKEGNKILFTSKGLGTSILPIRFNCIPEIVVIDFEKV